MTDPLKTYPRPPFAAQPQGFPGETARMAPEPDHGEASYEGSGKLAGKAALVTGGDIGLGRAARPPSPEGRGQPAASAIGA